MEDVCESYFSTLDVIKRDQGHLKEMKKRKDAFSKTIYTYMSRNGLSEIEHKGKKIKISHVKPPEIKKIESEERKLQKRERTIEKVKKITPDKIDEIMEIIFGATALKK